MARITLENVGKFYGSLQVLGGISLEIDPGEFVVLVGPSGCGKSTLLRMIAGLEDISAGRLAIDGALANDIPAKKRDIAMVFQSYALYPHMRVAENMSFALRLAGAPKDEIRARVAHAAEILGLAPYLKRYPRELSGGQRQRVAMGRAIVREPKVFLFDEPLSNLDAKLRVKMRGEIKRLHQRLGKTMIYVTHDQTEAMTMADKIVVLNGGTVAQVGAPLELYNNPDSLFVAGFIGSPEINLLPITATDEGAFLADGTALPFASRHRGALVYGIRPQRISVGEGGIEAQVIVTEPTGDAQEVVARIGAGQELSVIVQGGPLLQVGAPLSLRISPADVLLFDAQTGARLRE